MTTPSPGAVTELLRAWSDGDEGGLERLVVVSPAPAVNLVLLDRA